MEKVLDIVRLLKKISDEKSEIEILYYNERLLDDMFQNKFGGVTRLLQSAEHFSEQVIKAEGNLGIGGSIVQFLLNLKAVIGVEGKVGEKVNTIVENELNEYKKIALCEAYLEDQGHVVIPEFCTQISAMNTLQ